VSAAGCREESACRECECPHGPSPSPRARPRRRYTPIVHDSQCREYRSSARPCGGVGAIGDLTAEPLPAHPAICGLDPAGTVAAVGPGAAGLAIGQRVYVNPVRTCGVCVRQGKLNGLFDRPSEVGWSSLAGPGCTPALARSRAAT
jgi:hypothetical protein